MICRWPLLLFCLLLCPLALLAAGAARAADVRIAVLAYQGAERAAQDFEPTLAHLRARLPEHRFEMLPLDPAGIERAARARAVDFVITNPGDYVELEARVGLVRLATLERAADPGVSASTVGSTVIVRRLPGHPTQLRELRGRRVAVVSREAFGGWRVIWRELKAAGVSPADLAQLRETGFPMQTVIQSLRDGQADAGVLRSCMLEEEIAAGRVRADEFAVVGERAPVQPGACRSSSRLYPDWPLARLASTSPLLAKSVTASLLTMAPADGRAWTAPQDYSDVHALFRDLKIGPYAHLAHTTVAGFAREHWPWLAVASVAILWWVFHAVRVEVLVRRRTAELTRAIEGREAAERVARQHREERDQFSRLGILGEMASNIAHELNQPLAAIANYAEGITRVIDAGRPDTAFIRDGARGIAGQPERAGAIIRRIRGFVRRREVRLERLDLNELVRETLQLFDGQAQLNGVPVSLALAERLPRVAADSLEIEQVLLNLLQNALDAMAEGARKAQGVQVSTRLAGGMVEVAVRDHGSGLSPEVEAQLFDAFFTTKPQGLGLGLSICRTIVESHGGHLWAKNEPGGGVTLRFGLPVHDEEP